MNVIISWVWAEQHWVTYLLLMSRFSFTCQFKHVHACMHALDHLALWFLWPKEIRNHQQTYRRGEHKWKQQRIDKIKILIPNYW